MTGRAVRTPWYKKIGAGLAIAAGVVGAAVAALFVMALPAIPMVVTVLVIVWAYHHC
jgi:hypothetical protein